MPPLLRIPAAPPEVTVTRIDDAVYVRFTVPSTNVDGVRPADVARVEIHAITLDGEPRLLSTLEPDEIRKLSTLVASEAVRRPVPPPVPVKDGAPPGVSPPPAPGVDQGAVVVVRELLTPDLRTPVTVPADDETTRAVVEEPNVPRPLVAPIAAPGPRRYYFAVAVSARERHGPHTALQPAPLGATSSAPSRPEINVAETSATIRWTPAADARGVVAPTNPELLPSRSLLPRAASDGVRTCMKCRVTPRLTPPSPFRRRSTKRR